VTPSGEVPPVFRIKAVPAGEFPSALQVHAAVAFRLGSGRHTGMVLQYLPVLAFPAVVGAWLWQQYRNRQRRPALARFASQHSMRYSAAAGIDLPAYDFLLLRQGHDRGCDTGPSPAPGSGCPGPTRDSWSQVLRQLRGAERSRGLRKAPGGMLSCVASWHVHAEASTRRRIGGSMSQPVRKESTALLSSLSNQRGHVLGILEGLPEEALRRPVLPSGWTCLGLVQHLARDVERFWFRRVVAGEPIEPAESAGTATSAWQVGSDVPADAVFDCYRREIERANGIIAATPMDAAPAWWPDFFGDFRLDDLQAIMLHVITETACHAGHLDAVRELIDGRTWLVLTG
jgi:hypothetical protein